MSLAGRHLVSIKDLSDAEIEAVLALAEEMEASLTQARHTSLCQGRIMATLFYEPSTRTRLSFEAAMLRLGGRVIGFAEAATASSAAKGESIADALRVLGGYADVVVMRHPQDGSTRLAAEHCAVPLISGGDGGHEHPTQTLLDLYTIRREHGYIQGQRVAFLGDLLHARTMHSLAYGLARLGAQIVCIAPQELRFPRYVLEDLRLYGCNPEEHSLEEPTLDASFWQSLDALYVTRLQRERFSRPEELAALEGSYRITPRTLEHLRRDALILHPLPRTTEVDPAVDGDPRAAYFRQAAYGMPVRMALIALLLGLAKVETGEPPQAHPSEEHPNLECSNPRCITRSEPYAPHRFYRTQGGGAPRCYYCDYYTEAAHA